MSAPVNYACWSADTVTATIPTEAATPSNAVLLATHSPLRITRQRGDASASTSAEFVSEDQVLEEFLTAPPTKGVLVASVLGESGAGKSHLIRWVDANIKAEPGRHIIYLQKTETSLKDVIEKLLLDQQDPEFQEIRRKLSGLGSGMTLEEMEQKILAELAEALRTLQPDTALAKALVGDKGLMLFFLDPLFRTHLLRPDSFIKRRARYSLYGRDESEPDVPLEFTIEELPTDIGDYANIGDAAAATQLIFRRLAGTPALQVEAVRLLNNVLDTAVTKAASLNVGDVGQAFKRIREKFVGQEIVLLIEDVALIQGVRRDLLDAIVEVGEIRGVEKYATVRTMMAVTAGYYPTLADTFRRRAEVSSPIYKVDVELDAGGVEEQVFVDFVGRYLNAARVGKAELERTTPEVSNACDACQFQASCHAAFGASDQGHGLYPYNKAAVLRAVRACADKDHERIVFNPRRVLARAVRDVLNDNLQTIRDGAFPPANLLAEESAKIGLPFLPTHVREALEKDFSGPEAGRLESLLTFWGRGGTEQIDGGILEAFSHPPIPSGLFEPMTGRDRTPDQGSTQRPTGDELPRSLQKQLDEIDAWSTGLTLPQGLAQELRTIVRDALLTRIDWFDIVIRDPDTPTLEKALPNNSRTVSIEGANENLVGEPIVRLPRDARTAMMFRGLLFIKSGYWRRAGQALPRLDHVVCAHVGEAKRRVVSQLAVDDETMARAAASLIRGAAVCGQLPPKAKDLDYINAALWQDSNRQRPDSAARAPAWQAAYQAYVAERAAAVTYFLRGAGAAQGDGGVHAVDIQRLTAIIRTAKALAASDEDPAVPGWCEKSHRKLKDLTRLSNAQIEHWQGLIDRVRAHLPGGVSLSETVDAISDATNAGQSHGYVKVRDDLAIVHARNEAARSLDAAAITTVEKLVESAKAQSGLQQLSTLGTVAGADLPALADYLEYSARWIESGLAAAESGTGEAADVDEQLKETVRTWFEIVKESESDG